MCCNRRVRHRRCIFAPVVSGFFPLRRPVAENSSGYGGLQQYVCTCTEGKFGVTVELIDHLLTVFAFVKPVNDSVPDHDLCFD